jgi:hypothetical protein
MDSDDQNRFPKGIANSSPILKPQPRREQCRTYIAPTRKPFPPTMRTREPIGIGCNACIIAPDAFTSSARHRTTRSSPLGSWYDTRSQQRVGIRFPRLRSASVGARPVWLTHIKLISLSEKVELARPSPKRVSQEKAVVPRAGLNTAILSLFKANTASSRKQGIEAFLMKGATSKTAEDVV